MNLFIKFKFIDFLSLCLDFVIPKVMLIVFIETCCKYLVLDFLM